MGDPYNLVDWYVRKQTFDKFKGDKRNELLDLSSVNFFNEMKDYAIEKAETQEKKNAIRGLSYGEWKSEILNKTDIEKDANRWFDNKLNERIEVATIRDSRKNNIVPSKYNSENELIADIQEEEKVIKENISEVDRSQAPREIKQDIKSNILDFDSKEEVDSAIYSKVDDEYTQVKKELNRARDPEDARDILRQRNDILNYIEETDPNRYDRIKRALDGWQTRREQSAATIFNDI